MFKCGYDFPGFRTEPIQQNIKEIVDMAGKGKKKKAVWGLAGVLTAF